MPNDEYCAAAIKSLNEQARKESQGGFGTYLNTALDEGRKEDCGKIRLDLVPPEFDEYLARVFEYGIKKYKRNNWTKGFKLSRLEAAALRHIAEWRKGNKVDAESGLKHLWQAAWNLLVLDWYEEHPDKIIPEDD